MTITTRSLEPSDRAWFTESFQRYLAEIAPGVDLGPLDAWWQEVRRETLVILAPETVGFAMLHQNEDAAWELTEFGIFPQARRRGLGRTAVHAIFAARPGPWRLGVVRGGPAQAFWANVLPGTPGLSELRKGPPLFPSQILGYRFTIAGGDT